MATSPRAATGRIPASERREVLLREAGRAFGARGYDGARIEEIATAAGVTKPIVYRHFESKKALYLALLERQRADLPSFLEAAGEVRGDSTEDTIRAILAVWLDYVRANSHAWLMLFRDTSGDDEIRAARAAVSRRAREVLAAFVATEAGGRVPRRQVEPTAELLTSGLAGLALWWIDHPRAARRDILEVAARAGTGAIRGAA